MRIVIVLHILHGGQCLYSLAMPLRCHVARVGVTLYLGKDYLGLHDAKHYGLPSKANGDRCLAKYLRALDAVAVVGPSLRI